MNIYLHIISFIYVKISYIVELHLQKTNKINPRCKLKLLWLRVTWQRKETVHEVPCFQNIPIATPKWTTININEGNTGLYMFLPASHVITWHSWAVDGAWWYWCRDVGFKCYFYRYYNHQSYHHQPNTSTAALQLLLFKNTNEVKKTTLIIVVFNTLRQRQNDRHFPDDIFIEISQAPVPKCPINNIIVLVQMMAWYRLTLVTFT